MIALAFLQNNALDYCKFLNAPCLPPDKNAEAQLVVILCIMFGFVIFITAIYHAVTRLRIVSPKEFQEANRRLQATVPLLSTLQGRPLRRLCISISRDLVQVTGFTQKHLSRCFHEHYSTIRKDMGRMGTMIGFMAENKALRTDAIIIRCFPFTLRARTLRTIEAAAHYSTQWSPLLRQFRMDNPACKEL